MKINFRLIFNNFHPIIKLIFDVLMTLIIFFILFVLGSKLLSILYGLKFDDFFGSLSADSDLSILRGAQIMYSFTLFLLPPIFVSFFYTKKTANFFGLNKTPASVNYLNVIFLLFATLPIVNYLAVFNSGLHLPEALSAVEEIWRRAEESSKGLTEKMLSVDTPQLLILNLIMIALLPAIGEEVFFRGLFQKHLIEWTKNEHIGIFITAFMFSAFHFQFFTFIPRLFLGMVLGYLFVWSKSLWLPILGHFVNNAMAVITSYFVFRKTGSLSQQMESFGTDSHTFMYTIFSLGMFFIIMFFIYRNEKRKGNLIN